MYGFVILIIIVILVIKRSKTKKERKKKNRNYISVKYFDTYILTFGFFLSNQLSNQVSCAYTVSVGIPLSFFRSRYFARWMLCTMHT